MNNELEDAVLCSIARQLAYDAVCTCDAKKHKDTPFELKVEIVTARHVRIFKEALEQERNNEYK